MASPVTARIIPDDVAAARKLVQTTDFFALSYLMLCNLAYAKEDNGQQAVQQIMQLLPNLPVPQGTVKGQWSLSWGPQVTNDNSNLMYGAEFSDSASGLPVFAAVVIRGTDTEAKPSGVLTQLIEDLDAADQVPFPADQPASKIAQGTKLGLDVLTKFSDPAKGTVDRYVNDFVQRNPATPVVVTGHSLGGCQTTVMALFLSEKLPAGTSIVPNSFAAPTAGNPDFIQLYERTFPFCPRWFNPMDLVPMAFAGLDGIKQLWDQCRRPAPEAVKIAIDVLEGLLKIHGAQYAQQSAGNSRMLASQCQPPTALMATTVPMDQIVAEIQASFRGLTAKAPVPIPNLSLHVDTFGGLVDWVKELLFQHLILTGYWNAVAASPGVAQIRNPFVQAAGAGGNR